MSHAPEICLAVVVIAVVTFLTLNRTSKTPTMAEVVISAEPPRASASTPTYLYLRSPTGDAGDQ